MMRTMMVITLRREGSNNRWVSREGCASQMLCTEQSPGRGRT